MALAGAPRAETVRANHCPGRRAIWRKRAAAGRAQQVPGASVRKAAPQVGRRAICAFAASRPAALLPICLRHRVGPAVSLCACVWRHAGRGGRAIAARRLHADHGGGAESERRSGGRRKRLVVATREPRAEPRPHLHPPAGRQRQRVRATRPTCCLQLSAAGAALVFV